MDILIESQENETKRKHEKKIIEEDKETPVNELKKPSRIESKLHSMKVILKR